MCACHWFTTAWRTLAGAGRRVFGMSRNIAEGSDPLGGPIGVLWHVEDLLGPPRFRARAAERSRECLQLAVALRASAERVHAAATAAARPAAHVGQVREAGSQGGGQAGGHAGGQGGGQGGGQISGDEPELAR